MTAQQATEVTGLDIFWSRFGGWKAPRWLEQPGIGPGDNAGPRRG